MRNHASQIAGYGLSVVLTALVTLLAIPVIVAHSGASAWASIALGQAVGTGIGIIVGYGWATTGPSSVALAAPAERTRIYIESFSARATLALPGLVLAAGTSSTIAHDYKIEAGITGAGFALTGMLAGWFFTGSSKPYSFLLFDTSPRLIGTMSGVIALLLKADLVVFPTLQLVGVIIAIIVSSVKICGWNTSIWRSWSWQTISSQLRGQSHGMLIAGASALYISVPISVVAVVAPSALPAYALADKLLRFSTTGFAPIIQFLQGWVPGAEPGQIRRRIRAAFLFGFFLSLFAGIVFVVFLPWIASVLSHGRIVPDLGLSLAFGLILVFLVTEQTTGLVCLLSLNRAKRVALFTSIGALFAIPAVFLGAYWGGAQGAAWSLALAELVALVPQVILLAATLRARRAAEPMEIRPL